jgi:hypothetical protein
VLSYIEPVQCLLISFSWLKFWELVEQEHYLSLLQFRFSQLGATKLFCGKIKVMLSARYEDKGRSGVTAPHNLSSALDESGWSASRFNRKEKAPGTQWVGCEVGLTANLDSREEIYLLSVPRTELRFSGCSALSLFVTEWAVPDPQICFVLLPKEKQHIASFFPYLFDGIFTGCVT